MNPDIVLQCNTSRLCTYPMHLFGLREGCEGHHLDQLWVTITKRKNRSKVMTSDGGRSADQWNPSWRPMNL
eukprot:426745-Amphidinium_carterae.1